jgi:hypothetical protein
LVESKEHWGGDYTKRWCREVDNFKWTTLREVWYPCIVSIRRNKSKNKRMDKSLKMDKTLKNGYNKSYKSKRMEFH